MGETISLCGFNCGICPAYKPNLKSDEDRVKIDEGWKNFHKTRGWTYKAAYCEGCFNIPEKAPLWSSCPIRTCVLNNDVENCGFCLDYPCPRINNMIHATQLIAKRTREKGTQEDFQKFALPHLNKSRLEEVHQKVSKIIQGTEFQPVNTSTISFPSKLNPKKLTGTQLEPEKFTEALRNLHSTQKSIMTLHCRTPGGQEQELKRNKDNTKFLWVIGRHGKLLDNEDDLSIEITTDKIKKNLRYSKYKIKRILPELVKHGIDGNYINDKVRIRFTEQPETTIALQLYKQLLLDNYSERTAYSRFWKADMSVFSE
ncbi:MAG: DUF3795 domain-containing protein [Candidatus Hodarchaeota archaeon]